MTQHHELNYDEIIHCFKEYTQFSTDKRPPSKKEFLINLEEKENDSDFTGDMEAKFEVPFPARAGFSAKNPCLWVAASPIKSRQTNLFAPVRLDREFLPQMLEQKGGVIIHIASNQGRLPLHDSTWKKHTTEEPKYNNGFKKQMKNLKQ